MPEPTDAWLEIQRQMNMSEDERRERDAERKRQKDEWQRKHDEQQRWMLEALRENTRNG